MNRHLWFFLLFFSLFSSMLLPGCRHTDTIELSSKNDVTLAIGGDMVTINPLFSSDLTTNAIHFEVWQSLNRLHPKTNLVMPELASLPVLSADERTYTYTLDARARWSDGRALTAHDVIFTFKDVLNPASHADGMRGSFADLDSISSTKPDEPGGTISFHFSHAEFNHDYDLCGVVILPRHTLDSGSLTDRISWHDLHAAKPTAIMQQAGDAFAATEKGRDLARFIGTGPYIFEEWQEGQLVKLRRNPNYWAANIPWLEAYPDRLIYRVIGDINARVVALKKREVDIATVNSDSYLHAFDSARWSFIRKDTVYTVNCSYIEWNNARPIFRSVKTRRALAMLIDREAIRRAVFHGIAKPVDGPVFPNQPGWNPAAKQPAYDPVAAKRLLADDGWTDSDGDGILDKLIDGKRVPFAFTLQGGGRDAVTLMIAEDFRKAGIKIEIAQFDFSIVMQNLREHHFDAIFATEIDEPAEPDLHDNFHSSDKNSGFENQCGYSNPRADSLIDAIRVEHDQNRRWAMQRRLQQIIADDQPILYLMTSPAKVAWLDRFDQVILKASQPSIDPRYFIVRGAGVTPVPHTANP